MGYMFSHLPAVTCFSRLSAVACFPAHVFSRICHGFHVFPRLACQRLLVFPLLPWVSWFPKFAMRYMFSRAFHELNVSRAFRNLCFKIKVGSFSGSWLLKAYFWLIVHRCFPYLNFTSVWSPCLVFFTKLLKALVCLHSRGWKISDVIQGVLRFCNTTKAGREGTRGRQSLLSFLCHTPQTSLWLDMK